MDPLPPWTLMWLLALAIYSVCKVLTWLESCPVAVPASSQAGYLLTWPGMDADRFFNSRTARLPDWTEWCAAAGKLVIGIAVFFWGPTVLESDSTLARGWIGMIGLVLSLHFGLFHLLSCAWRRIGFDAKPAMNAPLCSESLSEFWGERWNRPFRDLTHRYLFRPTIRLIGPAGATMTSFAASGLIHDVVISIPAGSGFGLPTLYFLLQGAAVLFERSSLGTRLRLRQGWTGRMFAAVVIVVPLPWLFHRAFVVNVFAPFMQACGAW